MPTELAQSQDSFVQGLTNWVNEAGIDEAQKAARERAKENILECKQRRSPELDLSRMRLSSLPPEIGSLVWLQDLNIKNNLFISIPESIGELRNLRSLSVSNNQLSSLPESIGELRNLRSLSVSNNQLTSVPESIGRLQALQTLNIGFNLLNSLPESIGELRNLQVLSVSNNQLTSFPESVRRLREIRYIALDRNRLESTPTWLSELEQNRVFIHISNNPFNTPAASNSASLSFLNDVVNAAHFEEREGLKEFLGDDFLDSEDGMQNFRIFINRCSETRGGQENRVLMAQSLLGIIEKMQASEALKEKCLRLAGEALEECGDRVTYAYCMMLCATDIETKPIEQMNHLELREYARKSVIVEFLTKKALTKASEIANTAGSRSFGEEIETHLAYLQAASRLGLELPASQMLYQDRISGVNENDLNAAAAEFNALDLGHEIAKFIEQDTGAKKHPAISQLIDRVGQKFSLLVPTKIPREEEYKEYEEFQKRLHDLIEERNQKFLDGIRFFLENGTLPLEVKDFIRPSPIEPPSTTITATELRESQLPSPRTP